MKTDNNGVYFSNDEAASIIRLLNELGDLLNEEIPKVIEYLDIDEFSVSSKELRNKILSRMENIKTFDIQLNALLDKNEKKQTQCVGFFDNLE